MSRELKGMVLCVKNVKGIKGHGALCDQSVKGMKGHEYQRNERAWCSVSFCQEN